MKNEDVRTTNGRNGHKEYRKRGKAGIAARRRKAFPAFPLFHAFLMPVRFRGFSICDGWGSPLWEDQRVRAQGFSWFRGVRMSLRSSVLLLATVVFPAVRGAEPTVEIIVAPGLTTC